MDVFAIRADNLTSLIERLKDQGLRMRDIAQQFGGMDTSHLSQLKSRSSNMGHKVARKIEQAFDLPSGWFDSIHDEVKVQGVAEETVTYNLPAAPVRMSDREYDLIASYRICSREAKKIIDAAIEAGAAETVKRQSILLRTHGNVLLGG